ncbi:MAG TPA: diguanylate cyclase [Burkholderiales bacterium]|nr:diguanylate cyclase [Burkholderiales bacterium]
MAAPVDAKPDVIARLQQLPMRHPWLRWAVLAASVAFSAISTYYFGTQVRQEAHSRFETVAVGVANDVQSRIRAYGDVLFALRGLFDSSDKVSRDEFHRFAQALSLGERYPGVTNISFASRVPHARKLQFERAVRAETSPLVKGLPEFSIKPPGERPEYAVLIYIEPMGKNIPAWGLDLNADPLRRSVIERARDTGQMASSSGVTLLRDSSASVSSTLLRLALYRGGGVPGSVEERERLYWGMVGSTVRVGELIEATLSKEVLSRAQLQIYEVGNAPGEGAAGGTLLFDSAAPGAAATAPAPAEFSGHAVTHRLAVGDREWRLRIVPRKDPVDLLDKAGTAAILAALLAISALLFWLMTSVAVSESRGAELAQRNHEAAVLNELGEKLYSSLTLQAVYEVIARHLPRLLPETAGALFVFESLRSSAAVAAQWGDPAGIGEISTPDDCQSLSRRLLHSVSDSAKAQNCRHFRGVPPLHYSCAPLSAQGDLIGVLHVQRSRPSSPRFSEAEMYLVKAVAQHAGLALANLKLRNSLRDQSIRDHLTGLYNRRFLEESLARELARARRARSSFAVLMLDVDHFKRFNDQFGHEAGDAVLRALGRAIKGSCRRNDLPCRFGGEEFTVVLIDIGGKEATQWGERFLSRVRSLDVESREQNLGKITISAGVALYPEHGEDIETLLQAADIALYEAKHSGRDRLVVYRSIAVGAKPAGAVMDTQDLKPEK